MVNCIELVLFDETFQVREFDGDDTLLAEQDLLPTYKIV